MLNPSMFKKFCNEFVASTEARGIAPALVKIYSSNRAGIRKVLLIQSFDRDTSVISIFSWRQGTARNYSLYINECFSFSMVKII